MVTFQGGLLGFAVDGGVVNTFQPGPQRLVQLGQGGNFGDFHLRHELKTYCFKYPLDFSFSFWTIGSGVNALDAQTGASCPKLGGSIDLSVVDIDGLGYASAQYSNLEHAFHAWEALVEEKFGVGHQAGMVIDKGKQVRAPFLARLAGIPGRAPGVSKWQPRTEPHIALPQAVGMLALKTLEDPPGRGQQAARLAAQTQMGRQGVRIERLIQLQAFILFQNIDNHGGCARRLLFAQSNCLLHHFRWESAWSMFVGAFLGAQRFKALLLVMLEIAAQCGNPDPVAG